MNLPEVSIRRPVFAWMLMIGLIVFGAIAFRTLGISQLPDVDFPVITVNLGYEGASPEVMESDIVDPVEDALMTVQGIRSVTSYSRQGSASVSAEMELGRNIDVAMQEIQAKLAQAQRRLPREMDPPVVTKTNPEDQPILWVAVSSDRHETKDLMRYVRDRVKDRFSSVTGVGEVFLGGYIEPNLRVWVSAERLARYELAIGDVLASIRDEHAELPAGQLEVAGREIDVRTLGEAASVADFGDLVVGSRGGRPVYSTIRLKDLARVEEGLADVRRISRLDGKTAVGLGIRKQRGVNAVEVARAVKKRIGELSLPDGMTARLVFDTTKFIEDSVGELNFALVLSAFLTSLVCWLFLGSWTSTLNVLLAIPTSIVGAFMVISAFGFTLNTFTLLGLSLAIGIVVDDAIMVLENIIRHREKGKSRREAALDGSKEIAFAAVAATVAIVAIFLPVVFMKGVIGKFFFQFGVTMTATVLLSLLEALTLTPMRCSKFVEPARRRTIVGKAVEGSLHGASRAYQAALGWALRSPGLVVTVSLAAFAVSLAVIKPVKKELMPAQDQGRFLVRLQAPIDSAITRTDTVFKQAESILLAIPEISALFTAVGGFGGGEVNTGMIFVTLKEKDGRPRDPKQGRQLRQEEVMARCREALKPLKGIKVSLQDLSMRGFTASRGFPVEFTIRGTDWERLRESSEEMVAKLEGTGLLADLDTDYRLGKPEVRIVPDRAKAATRGVSVRAISETVNALIGGVVVGKYAAGGRRYDIRVRLEPGERDRVQAIGRLFVRNNRGELVRLSELTRTEERMSLQQIARIDRERAISVFANLKEGASQDRAIEAVQKAAKETLPEGYHAVMGGSSQAFKESFQGLGFALLLGIVVAYMVLASQFNSFIDPVTVLLALPFSVSGAFLALWSTGNSLNLFSFIGLVLLMGIVKKNSILLVEFANRLRAQGMAAREAMLEAGPVRLRPILMTSVATIAAAVPPALAIGPGAETRVPMAVAVIGGVLVSTLLTLVVVPCAYVLLSRLPGRSARVSARSRPEVEARALLASVAWPTLWLAAVLSAAVPAASAAAPSPTPVAAAPLSVARIVSLALEQSPELRASRARVASAEEALPLARAALMPRVDAAGSAAHRKDAANTRSSFLGGTAYNRYVLEVSASQTLFAWGALDALAVPRARQEEATLDSELREREIAQRALRAVFRLALVGRRQEALARSESSASQAVLTTERRARIGRSQKVDLLQSRAQLSRISARAARSAAERREAEAELAGLLLADEAPAISTAWTETRPETIESALGGEPPRYPELLAIDASRRSLSGERSATYGTHLPQLAATASWGKSSYEKTEFFDGAATGWSVGLKLTAPLFSGLSSFHQRRELAAREAALESDDAETRRRIATARDSSGERLLGARGAIASGERTLTLARGAMEEADRLYRSSTLDYLQYLSIEQAFLDAEIALDEARHDYFNTLVDFSVASGYSLVRLSRILQGD